MLYKITALDMNDIIMSESFTDSPAVAKLIADYYAPRFDKIVTRNTDTNEVL